MDINSIHNYLNEFDQKSATESVDDFYNNWSILIELITGVSINFAQTPLEKYALANTCAILIRQKLHLTN